MASAAEVYLSAPAVIGVIILAAGIALRRYGRRHEQKTRARPDYPAE